MSSLRRQGVGNRTSMMVTDSGGTKMHGYTYDNLMSWRAKRGNLQVTGVDYPSELNYLATDTEFEGNRTNRKIGDCPRFPPPPAPLGPRRTRRRRTPPRCPASGNWVCFAHFVPQPPPGRRRTGSVLHERPHRKLALFYATVFQPTTDYRLPATAFWLRFARIINHNS
jgi:hypothetical protein